MNFHKVLQPSKKFIFAKPKFYNSPQKFYTRKKSFTSLQKKFYKTASYQLIPDDGPGALPQPLEIRYDHP